VVLGFVLLSLAILGLLPFLQLGDGTNIPRFALFLGRFHPVVLHVPIGMILLAILLEHAHFRGLRRWIPKVPPGTSTFLMFFAAISATVSTVLGWMLSFSGGYDPALLQRHFIAGLATGIGANLALLVKLLSDSRPADRLARYGYQTLLLATGACLALAGHWGASITHGEDYLTEYAPDSLRHLLGLPVRIDPADLPWKPLPERIAFDDVVGPILNDRCVSCHSGQKAKGGLRLDRFDLVMKGGNGGAAIVPGDPAKSLLSRYIDLPEDDDKHMPPKGKTQVTDDERAILDWWIEAGAPETKTIGDLNVPADVQLAMERTVPEAIRQKQEATLHAQAATLAALLGPMQKSLHGSLRLIVPGEPNLEYSAGVGHAQVDDGELRQLGPVAENIVLLDLARTHITDAGLQSLPAMPNLARLEIQETNTGDPGLQWVGNLPALEVLNLYNTHVTDKGLSRLASLKKLRRVYVWRTQVTEAGVQALHKRLPQLDIVRAEAVPKIPAPAPMGTSGAPRPAKSAPPANTPAATHATAARAPALVSAPASIPPVPKSQPVAPAPASRSPVPQPGKTPRPAESAPNAASAVSPLPPASNISPVLSLRPNPAPPRDASATPAAK
jgi:uncharacterized membrane protein